MIETGLTSVNSSSPVPTRPTQIVEEMTSLMASLEELDSQVDFLVVRLVPVIQRPHSEVAEEVTKEKDRVPLADAIHQCQCKVRSEILRICDLLDRLEV